MTPVDWATIQDYLAQIKATTPPDLMSNAMAIDPRHIGEKYVYEAVEPLVQMFVILKSRGYKLS